jgi:hypothetical protein
LNRKDAKIAKGIHQKHSTQRGQNVDILDGILDRFLTMLGGRVGGGFRIGFSGIGLNRKIADHRHHIFQIVRVQRELQPVGNRRNQAISRRHSITEAETFHLLHRQILIT